MNIVMGVCGSIAAYKTFDILRGLIGDGHQVTVVLTNGATQFVVPNVFEYLGAKNVYIASDDFNPTAYSKQKKESSVLHIELAKWCDKLVIVPATANTIAQLAAGEASSLLTSLFLSIGDKPSLIFPAMNSSMLAHPITQRNIETLGQLENTLVMDSAYGALACGDFGMGKLPEVEQIIEIIPIIYPHKAAPTKKVLITTGATISPLDPVRYVTTPASGITGYYLAKKYLEHNFIVTVIAGKNSTDKLNYFSSLPNYQLIKINTVSEMKEQVNKYISVSDIYISSAAISDLEFESASEKIKKEKMDGVLNYRQSADILQEVLANKLKHQKIVGFAAETKTSLPLLKDKWQRKKVDLLVCNQVNNGIKNEQQGFAASQNSYIFLEQGEITYQDTLGKDQLAEKIFERTTK